MQDFEIRIRFSSDISPSDIIPLREALEEVCYDMQEDTFLYAVAGPIEAGESEWAQSAEDNLTAAIQKPMQKVFN